MKTVGHVCVVALAVETRCQPPASTHEAQVNTQALATGTSGTHVSNRVAAAMTIHSCIHSLNFLLHRPVVTCIAADGPLSWRICPLHDGKGHKVLPDGATRTCAGRLCSLDMRKPCQQVHVLSRAGLGKLVRACI